MPTVLDATVVNSAYQTSASARPQKLANGKFVTIEQDGFYALRLQISNDGQTWNPLCFIDTTNAAIYGFSIAVKDNRLYVFHGVGMGGLYTYVIDTTTQSNVNIYANKTIIDPNSSATWTNCKVSAIIDSSNIHVSYNKKLSGQNSDNIFYINGTINADGSVMWGAVEQRTNLDVSGRDHKNPSIIVRNDGNPVIIFESYNGGNIYRIDSCVYGHSSWTPGAQNSVYSGGTSYAQSSPSAIFIPAEIATKINASYTQGLIVTGWHGRDSIYTANENIFCRASSNGGVDWFDFGIDAYRVTSLPTGSQTFVSLTFNKQGEVFFVWHGKDTSIHTTYNQIRKIKRGLAGWGSVVTVTNATTANMTSPSALLDTTVNFSEPLFIYRNDVATKVGFYGTWTVTTISVTPGNLGQKSDKNNLLTYSITTDGTMGTITEKINGTVVNTRTSPTSGQQFTVSLTQEQWDAIKYGKYKDATGGLNTLTIEMGSDTWTYTFDKRLATDADVLSAVKAVQDSQTTYFPAVKAQLGVAIRSKGGTVNDTDSWDAMVSAVSGMPVKKYAKGTVTASLGVGTGPTISGLTFSPSAINVHLAVNGFSVSSFISPYNGSRLSVSNNNLSITNVNASSFQIVNNTGSSISSGVIHYEIFGE